MAVKNAFTLAELLIALVILGVIATFTIPKVLQSQQSGQWNAAAKETVAMVSGAYQAYLQENGDWHYAGVEDLTPYMNYVAVDVTTTGAFINCGVFDCLQLHNGGILVYSAAYFCDAPANDTALGFVFYVPQKDDFVYFMMHANGRIKTLANVQGTDTFGNAANGVCDVVGGAATPDPSWFSWN